MTLSRKDLAYFREFLNKHVYDFLLPLFRCDDIAWDDSTKQLLISGEVFAGCRYLFGDSLRRVVIAKKFRRNGGIKMIAGSISVIKVCKNIQWIKSFEGDYWCQSVQKNGDLVRHRKRQAAHALKMYNMNVMCNYNQRTICVT